MLVLARRAASFASIVLLAALAVVAGCGRSDLNDYLLSLDGGPEAGDGGPGAGDGGPEAGDDAPPDVADGSPCDATTCPTGCCDSSGQCQPGTDQTACGANGQACQNCAGMGETCVAAGGGGRCEMLPSCGPSNCKGCCQGNVCLVGTSDSACGALGQACQNCAAAGDMCSGQQCVPVPPPACNAQSCPGCCDASGTCQPGFVDTQCGQNGAACADCTAQQPPSTCDVNAMPRTCSGQQTQCPSPYPACPANLETPSPTVQNVCSAVDLQAASAACAAGAHSPGCSAFFAYEAARNPACGMCLSTFDYDFFELTGLFACLAPFVDASCNHDTACVVDCTDQSCAMCSGPAAISQCQNQVRGGQCASYYQGAQCLGTALFGQGSFCNPNRYQDDFGSWLAGVGKYYCAQ
jgi:hypothetical protein